MKWKSSFNFRGKKYVIYFKLLLDKGIFKKVLFTFFLVLPSFENFGLRVMGDQVRLNEIPGKSRMSCRTTPSEGLVGPEPGFETPPKFDFLSLLFAFPLSDHHPPKVKVVGTPRLVHLITWYLESRGLSFPGATLKHSWRRTQNGLAPTVSPSIQTIRLAMSPPSGPQP